MIRIAISVEAFEAIARTLPLGSVGADRRVAAEARGALRLSTTRRTAYALGIKKLKKLQNRKAQMRNRILIAALIVLLASPAFATDWWSLWHERGPEFPETCVLLKLKPAWRSESPAKEYETYKGSGWPARIVDKGDEVDVVTDIPCEIPHIGQRTIATRFFRNEQACRAAEQAEQHQLDPYR
jgi:hypothetical protein